ncbi:MAG: hypothetical protein ACYTG1_01250 [Planctomycetota bacterium]|jgi:flagellar M-ring protein FliF
MQAIQRALEHIHQHLRDLSATARLLVGALMVIVIMALVLVAGYAGRADLEPLGLKSTLSTEARGRAVDYLETRGIPFRARGSDLLVPPDQKYAILAQLTDGDVISPDQIDFDTLVVQDSPFLSKSQNERRWLVATMNVLSYTISKLDGIERATVVIDEPRNPGGIGRAHIPPSASANIVTRGGPLTQTQVDAIAEMVAGAHAELAPAHVAVIDARAGRVHHARSAEAVAAATHLELQTATEKLVRGKILDALVYIPGVNVAVHVVVDAREEMQHINVFEDPKSGVVAESSYAADATDRSRGAEPGVRPNTGLELPGAGGRASQQTEERSAARLATRFPRTERSVRDPKGYALQINTTIGVPKSYFVRLHQDQQNDPQAQPDQAALDALVQAETERIRRQVEPLVDTRAVDGAVAGQVAVTMVPDFAVPSSAVQSMLASDAAGPVSGGLVRMLGLGGLAVLSLLMMFMMVRKAAVREPLPSAEELVGVPPALAAAEAELVGEAEETETALEGIEIDDDQLRTKQMIDQINEMARDTPEEAASLLRKWIKTEL